jgi:hypothetical protein
MKTSSKLTIIRNLTVSFCCILFAANLMASPLSDAREAGFIKELSNGYVASKGKVTATIEALVKTVNQRRKTAYQNIAKQNGLSVQQVGQESYAKRYPGK